ncbi:MBL fold metallo-hydrolase [Allobranchiibius sp. CTAmp26]|uniref:MBL fold metallo-hydrolase n=1 Tax=Allobranchiibius sp. CTAmp26 TaxID=2815214 RepID=UPI001AA15A00|nr:MBL fold metallo-hydrolase [Allobranchiibius sp. CTAmp26]MBO1756920.1 MBL fold metallo-hydrolase [Allobranchiibius sp. CTAmp26]
MRLIRYSHSCVRLEMGESTIVIDPGIWSEPQSLRGADAVLVTHQHADHADQARLAHLSCPIFAPASASLEQISFEPVHPGESIAVAGHAVRVVGGRHAPVLPVQEVCANVGYLIGDTYHPGDALVPPPIPVDTLLVPMQASWMKVSEGVQFLRNSRYERAIGIHDGQINDRAIASINHWYAIGSSGRYRYLTPGSAI